MTVARTRIAVVGSLHYDILVTGGNRPRKGETVFGTAWSWKCGGKGGNQAIAAARHGADVGFVGAVGQDGFADALLEALECSGVNTDAVCRTDEAGSGMSVAIFDDGGDYGAVIVPGSNWTITTDMLQSSKALQSCNVLLLQNEVRPEINLAAARIARAAGATIILNAAPVRDLSQDLAPLVDILVVNEIEAEALSGCDPVAGIEAAEHAATILQSKVPHVIITLGAKGMLVAERSNPTVRIAGHQVAVESTHGAGDALIGALSTHLRPDIPLAQAARYANAAAAVLVSTREEDRAQITADDTYVFLRRSESAVP